ncbi:MAG: HYC_CC_PP family protein [Flavisolibacter sp.]
MKKFAATILAILYLVTSTGATIHMHYCMGKLKSSGLWRSGKHDACSTCGMPKKKGCCEDKHKILKLERQYNIQPSATYLTKPILEPPFDCYLSYRSIFASSSIVHRPLTNSPPGLGRVALYIANCVYRI